MSSMISVSDVTCRPALLACAITGPASWVTSTAGARVSSGARTERKTTSSRTRMNRMDKSRPRLTVRWLASLASAWAAAWPARWACRSPGSALARMAWRRPATRCWAGPSLPRSMLARTCNCAARPSRLTPRSLTCRTSVTFARRPASRPTAVTSAVVSLPPLRTTTTGTGDSFGSWNGVASWAACRLGLLAGRELVLLCLATLASDGKNRLARTVAATQATTMAQRKRTANRPVAAKNLCMRISPWSAESPRARLALGACQRRQGCGWWRSPGGRWRRAEPDDLVTAQCLQERLKAAVDQAPQDGTVNLDVADAKSALYLPRRRGADEADLYALDRRSIRHARHARSGGATPASVELPIRHLMNGAVSGAVYTHVMARPSRRVGNLPAEATSFIGRRRELAEVRNKLTEARLVSLVGPGGVGKTRLAIRAATDLRRGFRGGGWLVELAEVLDPALVSNAVMAALDLRDQAASAPAAILLSYLQDLEVLLVVDNCEHLLEVAGRIVTDMMKAAPGVRVIATSREPLSVPGEHVVPVPPLELPSPRG